MLPVPLFGFLSNLEGSHVFLAFMGSGLSALLGLILLMLWVPTFEKTSISDHLKESARTHVRAGVGLLVFALASVILGLYVWSILIAAMLVFVIWVVINGVRIALGKER